MKSQTEKLMDRMILRHPVEVASKKLILIIDSDTHSYQVLGALFKVEGYDVVLSKTIEDAWFKCALRKPDAMVLNVVVGKKSGIEALRNARSVMKAMPIVMIEDAPDLDKAVEAMAAGATYVFAKPVNGKRLLHVVQDNLVNIRTTKKEAPEASIEDLTPRERQVLQSVVNGHSNRETALELGISPRTVEVHRARVMEKFGAKNAADLMRMVFTR